MPWRPRALAFMSACLLLGAAPVVAQVPGLPVWRPLAAPGVVLEAEVAWPNDAMGGGAVQGGAVGYGEGGVVLRGSIARVDPSAAGAQVGWGAVGRVSLAGAHESPFRAGAFVGVGGVRVQSGASSATTYRVPLGLDVGIVIPTPMVMVGAWLAPRLDLATEAPFVSRRLTARPGFSAGLEVSLPNGLGLRAGYDHVVLDSTDASTFGLGLFYRFSPGY